MFIKVCIPEEPFILQMKTKGVKSVSGSKTSAFVTRKRRQVRNMDIQKLVAKKRKARIDKNDESLITFTLELADLYSNKGKYIEAIKEYEEAKKMYEKQKKFIEVAKMHRMIGEIYSINLEKFSEALEHVKKYLKIAEKENNLIEEQRAHATLGRTYFCAALCESVNTDLLNFAQLHFLKSVVIIAKLDENVVSKREQNDMKSRLLLNLGNVYENQNDFKKAEQYIRRAIELSEKSDLFDTLQQSHHSLGLLYAKAGDVSKAMSSLSEALEIASRLTTERDLKQCEVIMSMSELLIEMADYKAAKQYLVRAYKLQNLTEVERQRIIRNLKTVAQMYYNEESLITLGENEYSRRKKLYEQMGDGACQLRNFKKAIDYYNKMLECVQKLPYNVKDLSAAYTSLAQTYKDTKQYQLAMEFFEKDLQLNGNLQDTVENYLNMAEVEELAGKSYEEFEVYYLKAREIAQKANSRKYEEKVMIKLNLVQKRFGQVEKMEALKKEREELGFDTSDSEKEEEIENTPNIGDELNLSDISDLEDNDEKVPQGAVRSRRNPGIKFKQNAKGEWPLHLACISGKLTQIKTLLKQGHPVNCRDNAGWLPIHEAANYGYLDVVKTLIKYGADVNDRGGSQCGGQTPLHDAAANGHLYVILTLLEHGASPNMKNNDKQTPLNVLLDWKERFGLNPEFNSVFETVVEKMSDVLKKTGNFEENIAIPSSSNRKSYETPNKRRSISQPKSGKKVTKNSTPVSPETHKRVLEFSDEEEIGVAARQYRDVIESCRGKSKVTESSPRRKSSPRKPALVTEGDIRDDWLVDDLGPSSKRRRTSNESERRSLSLNVSRVKSERFSQAENSDSDIEERVSVRSFKRKSQTTLLSSGFTRNRSNDSIRSIESVERTPNRYQPDSTTFGMTPPKYSSIVAINVHIENKIWRIPIQMKLVPNLSIAWLAEEAGKRYYNKEGIKPELQLETKDQAILDENDPLEMIMGCEELFSTVLSWHLPPIIDRYVDVCESTKTVVDLHLQQCLLNCQQNLRLIITNLNLTDNQIIPVLRAIKHQKSVGELNLSGNLFTDDIIKILCEVLPTLTSLHTLNLSCNLLTWKSVKYMEEMFKNHPTPTILINLHELNLSFNRLEDDSIKHLSCISKYVKLKTLQLESCELSMDSGYSDLDLNQIEKLNLSDNRIGNYYILNSLNPCILTHIDLSNTMLGLTDELLSILSEGTPHNLESINLSRCNITDFELKSLLDRLKFSRKLNTINLSQNKELTYSSFKLVIETQIAENMILDNCFNILNGFCQDEFYVLMNVAMKSNRNLKFLKINCKETIAFSYLSNFWKNLWSEKALIHKSFNSNVQFSIK